MHAAGPPEDPVRTLTLEAFADTIIPGEKRSPDDAAIAGAAAGGGAVEAGALTVLAHPALGLADSLDGIAAMLNMHAGAYARKRKLSLDPSLPAFVALSFDDRTALVQELTDPQHPEQEVWFGVALFCTMAFDSAPHLSTVEALRDGHPGLAMMGYSAPDADGLWRFPAYSYGRELADKHPGTTKTGSPA